MKDIIDQLKLHVLLSVLGDIIEMNSVDSQYGDPTVIQVIKDRSVISAILYQSQTIYVETVTR